MKASFPSGQKPLIAGAVKINFHGKHPIVIRVLDEIPYASFANLAVEELSQMVWDYIQGELVKLQKEMYYAGAGA